MSSKYKDREGHTKVPYKYPAWVTEGRDPPPHIQEELERAKGPSQRFLKYIEQTVRRS